MKKFMFMAVAATLAVGLTAFSPAKKDPIFYYYKDAGNHWQIYFGDVCPQGTDIVCLRPNPAGVGLVEIYTTPLEEHYLFYNPD